MKPIDKFGEQVLNDPRVLQWLELIEAAPSTRRTYGIFMRQFCECTKMLPGEHIDEAIKEIKAGKFGGERSILGHIAMFKKCQKDRDVSPNTFGLSMTAINSFFKSFDIVLPAMAGKNKKRDPLYENKNALKYEEVKHIISNALNARESAILLLISTSGLARREVINLRVRDIVFDDEGIGTIYIRRKKTSVDFVTFTTPETKAALDNYYKLRNRDPKFAIKDGESFVFINYQDGGQLNENTYVKLFELMAERLGFENMNNNRKGLYNRMHSHAFRSFTARRFEDAGCPRTIIKIFMGHSKNSVDKAYYDYDPNNPTDVAELKEKYKLYINFFSFNSTYELHSLDKVESKKLEEQEKNLARKEKEIIELRQQVLEGNQKTLDSRLEIDQMKEQLTRVEAARVEPGEMKAVKKKMAELEQYLAELQPMLRTYEKSRGFAGSEPPVIDDATAQKMQEEQIKWLEKRSPEEAAKLKVKKKVTKAVL